MKTIQTSIEELEKIVERAKTNQAMKGLSSLISIQNGEVTQHSSYAECNDSKIGFLSTVSP